MRSKRDYKAEIIQALRERPRNGFVLLKDLHISKAGILKSMEEEGLIRWVPTEGLDGEWRPCKD